MRKLFIDGHGPGGLIGITLHEKAVLRWARARWSHWNNTE